MTPREAGFLLLTSTLGDCRRKVLTDAQLRTLARRSLLLNVDDPNRELALNDLLSIGYSVEDAERILHLLSGHEQLEWCLQKGQQSNCYPLTRISEGYPPLLREKLGLDSPGCLWLKGNRELLKLPAISLVGNRELMESNAAFAREVGRQAALQGYALVSGNARGADREAQNACLENGGCVICVVADKLCDQPNYPGILYISESGFDLEFSSQRALHRNAVIHCLGTKVFVAQCQSKSGGTWSGTMNNLRGKYSPVFCFNDGSDTMEALIDAGCEGITQMDLLDFSALQNTISFL